MDDQLARQIEGQIVKGEFRPNSVDAQLARILTRLDNQDQTAAVYRAESKEVSTDIKALLLLQNGRVAALEREKWMQRGFVAAISVAGTAFWQWVTAKK